MPEPASPPAPAADEFTLVRRRVVLLSLTWASSLGIVASTIYVPSVPAIARAFDTPVARVQLTFVGYLLAFAISMLVLGPLSDRYGRRRTVLCGLALCALSSFVCAFSPTIEVLIAARVLQGIGACAGMVVGRALTREIWGPEAAAQVIAGRAIAATLMQACAPVLGGYLQEWFGWRANFAAVAVLAGFAMVLMVRYVPDRGNRPARACDRRRHAGELSHPDRHPPFSWLCPFRRRRPCRVSHLRGRRSRGADRPLRGQRPSNTAITPHCRRWAF